jgi:hypothetical protein
MESLQLDCEIPIITPSLQIVPPLVIGLMNNGCPMSELVPASATENELLSRID